MAVQSFLAKDGLRTGLLGSSSSLAIAFALANSNYSPLAVSDATRIGFYADRTAAAEKIGVVVMGTEVCNMGVASVNFSVPVVVAAALRGTYVTLVDGANIATNAALGNNFTVTLTGSATMSAPTNPYDGQTITYRIVQGGAGSYTMTWNAVFDFTTTVPSPTLSTTVGKEDYLTFKYSSSAVKWRVMSTNIDD